VRPAEPRDLRVGSAHPGRGATQRRTQLSQLPHGGLDRYPQPLLLIDETTVGSGGTTQRLPQLLGKPGRNDGVGEQPIGMQVQLGRHGAMVPDRVRSWAGTAEVAAVPRCDGAVRLVRGCHDLREPHGGGLRLFRRGRLDHHPHQLLGARGPQQHPS
jgi:hypothetical protein